MDRVILNLISLLVAGTGIFSVLTKFYILELDATFLGYNPFAIKANAIDDVTTKIFIGLGVCGLLLQAFAIIFDDCIPNKAHSKTYYASIFLLGLSMCLVGIWALKNVGYYISKRIWVPQIVESQKEIFQEAKFILDHDGWRQDQLDAKDRISDSGKYRKDNFEQAAQYVDQIEKLLDIKNEHNELRERIKRLEVYFN